jgi:hypothetical protein
VEEMSKEVPLTKPIPRVFEMGGYGVDVKLTEIRTTVDIFWSTPGCNSYVLADSPPRFGPYLRLHGRPVALFSINGIGELRWSVEAWYIHSVMRHDRADDEQLQAFNHFGLTVDPQEE